MKRFGFVAMPEKGSNFNVRALAVEHGECVSTYTQDDLQNGKGFPQAAWFTHAETRDAEMQAWAQKHPGVMFCPVQVESGMKFAVQQKATQFSISEKGVLPR